MRLLLKELQGVFHFESSVTRTASVLFEDNIGALTLANVPKLTPRSKNIAIPYHFFREFIRKKEVEVVRVETNNQLVDMLTKGLVQVKSCKSNLGCRNADRRQPENEDCAKHSAQVASDVLHYAVGKCVAR